MQLSSQREHHTTESNIHHIQTGNDGILRVAPTYLHHTSRPPAQHRSGYKRSPLIPRGSTQLTEKKSRACIICIYKCGKSQEAGMGICGGCGMLVMEPRYRHPRLVPLSGHPDAGLSHRTGETRKYHPSKRFQSPADGSSPNNSRLAVAATTPPAPASANSANILVVGLVELDETISRGLALIIASWVDRRT